MIQTKSNNPFHRGERQAQQMTGAGDVQQWASGFIRDYLPEQHREFHTSLPFLIVSGEGDDGHIWVTLLEGEEGFIASPDNRSLMLDTNISKDDPLASALETGGDIGAIGIELASRRRNRFSGFFRKSEGGYAIDVHQTFGNCPQYIHERVWTRAAPEALEPAISGTELSSAQMAMIKKADTLFIGSGFVEQQSQLNDKKNSRGFDASHRGGAPGFVNVLDSRRITIPDYAGNNFFNTIGNLLVDQRIGLMFIDFETGNILHITGRAEIDWQPRPNDDPEVLRLINIEIQAVIERPSAIRLRWHANSEQLQRLVVTRRVDEAQHISSFYLSAAEDKLLPSFRAGQHLPVQLKIPGHKGTASRSYSLSGNVDDKDSYRITVKREENGLVSRFFHDEVSRGSIIEASSPSGDFVVPCRKCPLVLVSAGVGITPMISMLQEVLSENPEREVWFVHGARNGRAHALREEVDALTSTHKRAQHIVFYSKPDDGDIYDRKGRITAGDLDALNVGEDAHYMLCGPAHFLSDIRNGLEEGGVPPNSVHFETFGPKGL